MSGTPNQAFGETARDKSPSNAAGGLAPPSSCPQNLRVNGRAHIITVEPRTTLLDALRAGNVADRIIRVDCAFSGPCPVSGPRSNVSGAVAALA